MHATLERLENTTFPDIARRRVETLHCDERPRI